MAKRNSKYSNDDPKLKPFEDLGFVPSGASNNEVYGTCPICGRENKFYVNTTTQQWQCKHALCGIEGNLYTYIAKMYEYTRDRMIDYDMDSLWETLSADRGLPVEDLKEAGLVWDGVRWWFPVINHSQSYVNMRFYRIGSKVKNLTGCEVGLIGLHGLMTASSKARIWVVEGEWDYIALKILLRESGLDDVVLAVPGSGVFKEGWIHHFKDREVVLAYDNDEAGRKGKKRAFTKIKDVVSSVTHIDWPQALPNKFDIRDFRASDGTIQVLHEMNTDFDDQDCVDDTPVADIYGALPALSDSVRPTFSEVVSIYKEHLYMTVEMEDALKVVFAVAYSNQLEGDPLWIHIAGPPGSGKTELLMSLSQCSTCEIRSTVTPHSLVSGFQLPGGKDPSLIPNLIGKTFILKDFTEVLQMPRNSKDEVYSILRGAYDGEVSKPFGNGLYRQYKGYFSMITGVTQAIFAESGTSLGERFLIYHFVKGVGFDADQTIMAAIGNSGEERNMKIHMQLAAKSFLDYRVDPASIPFLPQDYVSKLVGLAQFVAMLRGSVERDFTREKLKFRPQHEMGTRLAKQFKKLLLGLALTNDDYQVSEDNYRLVVRVALDTCVGFNLEIIRYLIKYNGCTTKELSEDVSLPITTCRETLEDMLELDIVYRYQEANPTGLGAPQYVYCVTDTVLRHWNAARVGDYIHAKPAVERVRHKFRKGAKT